jgi:hypothetical protein
MSLAGSHYGVNYIIPIMGTIAQLVRFVLSGHRRGDHGSVALPQAPDRDRTRERLV